MNLTDWCFVIVAVCGLFFGYQRGLVGQLISLAGLIVAYIAAYNYYKVVSSWLDGIIQWPELDSQSVYGYALQEIEWQTYVNNAIAFISIFIIVKLACSIVGGIFNLIVKVPGLNMLNKWSGAMLGLLGATVIIIVAVNVMSAIPSEPLQQQLKESQTTQFIKQHLPEFINPLDIWPSDRNERVPYNEPRKYEQPIEAAGYIAGLKRKVSQKFDFLKHYEPTFVETGQKSILLNSNNLTFMETSQKTALFS